MRLYEHASSGNCLKCRILLRQLGLPYESVSVDLFRGETRTLFEQNRIEADLAVARFMRLAGRDATFPEAFANRLDRGRDALATLERSLADGGRFLAGDAYTIAHIAVYGYGHCAGDAGADPRAHPHVAAWLDRVEATPGFVNDLEPVPAHVAERPI
jgi:glutathione S-transferase